MEKRSDKGRDMKHSRGCSARNVAPFVNRNPARTHMRVHESRGIVGDRLVVDPQHEEAAAVDRDILRDTRRRQIALDRIGRLGEAAHRARAAAPAAGRQRLYGAVDPGAGGRGALGVAGPCGRGCDVWGDRGQLLRAASDVRDVRDADDGAG